MNTNVQHEMKTKVAYLGESSHRMALALQRNILQFYKDMKHKFTLHPSIHNFD